MASISALCWFPLRSRFWEGTAGAQRRGGDEGDKKGQEGKAEGKGERGGGGDQRKEGMRRGTVKMGA